METDRSVGGALRIYRTLTSRTSKRMRPNGCILLCSQSGRSVGHIGYRVKHYVLPPLDSCNDASQQHLNTVVSTFPD